MFEIQKTASFNKNKLTPIVDDKQYAYVTRTSQNNGILQYSGFVNENNINSANTYSLGLLQMNFFFQQTPWYAGQFVRKIIPKFPINNLLANYFETILNKQSSKLLSVLVREIDEVFRNIEILLPTHTNGEIAFDYMEDYIKELEAERIKELEAYLVATGLDEYVLSDDEEKLINNFKSDNVKWGEFNITDIFTVTNTHTILKNDIIPNSGDFPYITAGEGDNAVSTYISYDQNKLEEGNSIMIGGKTMVITYQPFKYFSNDSHNLSLVMKKSTNRDKLTQLFLVTALKTSLGSKYEWGNSISNKKIQSDIVMLPINSDGLPDYQLMNEYMKVLQKIIIKAVVEWKDQKIKATRKVVSKNNVD